MTQMTLLDSVGSLSPTPASVEALMDSIALVHELTHDPTTPLYLQSLGAAESSLKFLSGHQSDTACQLANTLWALRQQVLEGNDDTLQSYALDVMLSIALAAVLKVAEPRNLKES